MTYAHHKYTNYSCDELGNVFGKNKNKPIGTKNQVTGYNQFTAHLGNGKLKTIRKHRFIYECFYGKDLPSDMVVNHINGVKTDNRLSNLELVTPRQNTQHAVELGLIKPKQGTLNGNCTITAETARGIIREILNTSKTNKEIGEKFKLSAKHISSIRHKRRWAHLYLEPEFVGYTPTDSATTTSILQQRQLVIVAFCLNTTLTNTYLSLLLKVDQSTISRVRAGKLYKSPIAQLTKESSTTIENLMSASELVEYRQATGSGVTPIEGV